MADSKKAPAERTSAAQRGAWSWRARRPLELRHRGLELPEVPAEDLKTAEWRVLGLVQELTLLVDRFLRREPDDLLLMEQIVATLIQYGIESEARSLLFEPGTTEMRVRLRMDEPPKGTVSFPQSLHRALFRVLKEAAGLDLMTSERPQSGVLLATHGAQRLELRLACLPGAGGEVAHLHLPLPDIHSRPAGLHQLGLFPDLMEPIARLLSQGGGLIAVTGPSGSGKSTTLYALLNRLDLGTRHTITIEDPIESLVRGTTQLKVDPALGLTFSELLHISLREEPETVMLSDLPDLDTARLALQAARNGRKVLAGFPSDRAAAVPADLISMGVLPYQVAAGLAGVLSQRRARRLCDHCKRPDPNAALHRDRLCSLFGIWDHFPQDEAALTAGGCQACRYQGYSGHVTLFECLLVSRSVRAAILRSEGPEELEALALREGMVTLASDGYRRVKMGEISLEELLRVLEQ